MDTITIVVPCFNEQETLPYFYEEYLNLTRLMNYVRLELLFIDDGSTDGTKDLVAAWIDEGEVDIVYKYKENSTIKLLVLIIMNF